MHSIHTTPFVIHPSDELAKNIDLKNLSRNLASKYADGHMVTDDDLQIMGRNLWSGLSAGAQGAFEAARKEAGEKILPVVIHSEAADVQALPWETLFHPTYGFIGKNPDFTLTRRSSAQEAAGELDQGPLRVLLFTSLPANVDPERSRLKVEEEQAEVQAALLPWIAQGLVTLEMPDDGRFSTLQNLLKEFQPHVLFLSGHGNFHHMPHANEAYGEFFFEDEAGDSVGVKEDEIADALRGTGVQAVILSACESGKAASDELSNGLTRKISAAGIPHVVGMREAIYDVAGIQFARALCDSLARQERMDVALQAARIAIQTPFKDVARASSSIGDELSYGQWCLPLLISSAPSRALIDWDFTPREVEARAVGQKINTVVMPARFIGRRAEMRKYKNSLLAGKIHSLLITGPGGQGKTSLAGKLALDLQTHGYRLFAWSARPENSWRDFELEMEQTLDRPRVDRYDKFLPRAENESARAQFMLDLLMEQFNRRIVLFLDNLETIQDPDTLALKDPTVEAWLRAANQTQDMILLVTSRWQIPDWNGEHEPLTHVTYGDFLQIAQRLSLPPAFLTRRNSLRQVYDILGGNVRGLEFFASAVRNMENSDEESAFLEKLSAVKEDLQANMAIETIYSRLLADAKTLLHRLPAFHEPVPMEGLLKLAPDLPNPESLLERLLAVSLLEASYEPHWKVNEYQCPQMVVDWMREKGLVDDSHEWLNIMADYHVSLLSDRKNEFTQSVRTYYALMRSDKEDGAYRILIDHIVYGLALSGAHNTLVNDLLLQPCKSRNLKIKGDACNLMGKSYVKIGDTENALMYLEESLEARRKIKDKIGEAYTLSNLSEIYTIHGDYEKALLYLNQCLDIAQKLDDRLTQGRALNSISRIYYLQRKNDLALAFSEKALIFSQGSDDKESVGQILNNISMYYAEIGDYENGLSFLNRSLEIRKEIGDLYGIDNALNNIGEIYRRRNDEITAITYYKQALNIQQQSGNKHGEQYTLNNMSLAYIAQGDYENAQYCLEKAQSICIETGNRATEATVLNNLSRIFIEQGDYFRALDSLKKGLAIRIELDDVVGQSKILMNISHIYYLKKDYKNAISSSKDALNLVQNTQDKLVVLDNMSLLYKELEDHESAIYYLEQSLIIYKGNKDIANEDIILEKISKLHTARGDFKSAISSIKKSMDIKKQTNDMEGIINSLFEIGFLNFSIDNTDEALSAWLACYMLAKRNGNFEVIKVFSDLAPKVGLGEGLKGWDELAKEVEEINSRRTD